MLLRKLRFKRLRFVAIGAGIALIAVAWMLTPSSTAGPCSVVDGRKKLPEIPEASGLTLSRRSPGLMWSHNDSGNLSELFAFDSDGTVRGRVQLPIQMRDWEDISAARCSSGDCLYLADIGDNRFARRQIQIYRIPEPAPGDTETPVPDVFNATYADSPHDAEAAFVIGEDLFVITKDRTGVLYRSIVTPDRDVTLQRIGHLGLTLVTDAEASPDGAAVVVRTSHEAVFYRTEELLRGENNPYLRISLDGLKESQGEGVAFDGKGMLYLVSEGRPWSRSGKLLSLRCTGLAPVS
jgi:hypothetical protein